MFVQGSLLDAGIPSFDSSLGSLEHIELDDHCWLDHLPSWLGGSDAVFDALLAGLSWARPEVHMYERLVEQPRSTAGYSIGSRFDFPFVDAMAAGLGAHYGVRFGSVWCNLYCDGHDSVAWHGDRVLRDRSDGLVVIVSVGHRRRFLIKPAGGGPSRSFALGRGDLFVMGGDCQRRWRHCVPKVAPASLVGPRISITMRPT